VRFHLIMNVFHAVSSLYKRSLMMRLNKSSQKMKNFEHYIDEIMILFH